jgi:hypothetical protein
MIGAMQIINSRRDIYGNCYFAGVYTDGRTDQSVSAAISGGESNARATARLLGERWGGRIMIIDKEVPIREFDRWTKTIPHAGCTPEEIARNLVQLLNEKNQTPGPVAF